MAGGRTGLRNSQRRQGLLIQLAGLLQSLWLRELAQRLLRLLYLVPAGLRSVIAPLPLLLCYCAGDDLLIDFFADAACCAYAGASAAMETRVTPVSCARQSAVT